MFVLRADRVDDVLARFAKAMQGMPRFEVKTTFVSPGRPVVRANFVIDRRDRMFYHADGVGVDYTLSISPAGYREIDKKLHIYDDLPYQGPVHINASRISPWYKTLPSWITAPSLQALLPRGSKFSHTGSGTVGGHKCDHLHSSFSVMGMRGTLDVDVAESGLVYKYRSISDSSNEGHVDVAWTFSDYVKAASYPQSKFENRVPDGYVPFSLPEEAGPIVVGQKPRLGPWIDSSTGRSWRAPAGKPVLYLVAGHDSAPSERVVRVASKWRQSLSGQGVTLALVSDSGSSKGAGGLLYDPSLKNIDVLAAPATPLFVLLDSSGKVTNLWLGFEPANAQKLRSDISKAIADLKG